MRLDSVADEDVIGLEGQAVEVDGKTFCGAAYHKDCFEAVLEGDKKCVNCGRKLALTLDTKGEEAVSGIKDLSS